MRIPHSARNGRRYKVQNKGAADDCSLSLWRSYWRGGWMGEAKSLWRRKRAYQRYTDRWYRKANAD